MPFSLSIFFFVVLLFEKLSVTSVSFLTFLAVTQLSSMKAQPSCKNEFMILILVDLLLLCSHYFAIGVKDLLMALLTSECLILKPPEDF